VTQAVGSDGEGHLPADAVRECLAAMLAADPLCDSPQLSAFLSFIVEEALQGRGDDLKGYSIATLALGRPESFDPQTDPIVRVQAGRLRQAMAEYHAARPREPVRIILDKGVYVPRFERAARQEDQIADPWASGAAAGSSVSPVIPAAVDGPPPSAVPAAAKRRGVWAGALAAAVIALAAGAAFWPREAPRQTATVPPAPSFERYAPSIVVEAAAGSDNPDLQGLVQRTRDAISRFDDLVIVHDIADMVSSVTRTSPPRPGQALTLRLAGIAASEGKMRVAARLIDQADQSVIWSREFEPIPVGPAGDGERTKIVRAVATTVAQPYGVIHAHVRNRLQAGTRKDDPFGCVVAGFDYWRINDVRTHAAARDCLMLRIRDFPTIGSMHSQLTYLHLEEFRQGYNPLPGNPLDRALESALRAATLAPASARSQQALLAAHFARDEMESAWRAAGQAMALNPFDTEVLADVGARHVQSGAYEKGLGMLQEALELNPAPPAWAATFRALALFLLGRLDEAGAFATGLRSTEYPPAMMALVMVARQNFDAKAGKQALADMQRLHPGIVSNPAAYLKRLHFDDSTIGRVVWNFSIARDWAAGLP
jgi:Tfp pilus assembly protein PilF